MTVVDRPIVCNRKVFSALCLVALEVKLGIFGNLMTDGN